MVSSLLAEISDDSEKLAMLRLIFDVIRSDGELAPAEARLFWNALDAWSLRVGDGRRHADGAGVTHMHLAGFTPTPAHPKLVKTALGAEATVAWTLHRDGTIDFAHPAPEPAPFTTIAWRLAHVVVGVLAMRNHSHFGGPPADYQTWPYATDAATALAQLDDAYRNWYDGVRQLGERDLATPVGPAEGPWADRPMLDLILHINREVIHHGAEIACVRDLYVHRQGE